MVKAVDIEKALAKLPVLHGRGPETSEEEAAAAFATLVDTRDGGVFAGSFDGESPWERHLNGDELVQVLAGETTLTIVTDGVPEALTMKSGMLTIVPQGCWHRFNAPDGVTVLTMTPQPTEHTTADEPWKEA